MSSAHSITHWIEQLKAGDPVAAQQLWERYYQRLVELARRKLQGAPLRAADEEDVALSAFHSFCRAAEAGRFPQLFDRDDLWQLLVVLTARKAADLVARERRQKRGGGAVQHESALPAGDSSGADPGFAGLSGREPDPRFAAEVAEESQRLLDALGDEVLRSVAVWKMEGYSNAEIADRLGRSEGTVERKLRLIRQIWGNEGTP